MQKVICPYCGRVAKYVDSSVIYYGHSYGMAYLCRPCNAYVGVHSGTDRPKGSLANAELRGWRKATHARFDPLWQDGPFKSAMQPIGGCPNKWNCRLNRPTSECSLLSNARQRWKSSIKE